jgi:hypothetical protein
MHLVQKNAQHLNGASMRKALLLLLAATGIMVGAVAIPGGDWGSRLGASAIASEHDIWFRLHPPANARPNLRGWWLDNNSQYLHPPNEGFAHAPRLVRVAPGTRIDRYGPPTGRYLAAAGTSYEARSLPYDRAKMEYHRYVVVRRFPALIGRTASWFDHRGGAVQYRIEKPVQQMIDEGYLRKIR